MNSQYPAAQIDDRVGWLYPPLKVIAGKGPPHYRAALLDACKSAAINGLLMFPVCHPLITRNLATEKLMSAMGSLANGLPEAQEFSSGT